MKIYKPGDKGRAACPCAASVVSTTFERRTVPFSDGRGEVKDVLVGVCDRCGSVVSVPVQSTVAVKAAREAVQQSIEAVLPAMYLDVMDLCAHKVNQRATPAVRRVLFTYFLDRSTKDFKRQSFTSANARGHLLYEAGGDAQKRLSMKVPLHVKSDLLELRQKTDLSSTEIIKALVIFMQQDILEEPDADVIRELACFTRMSI